MLLTCSMCGNDTQINPKYQKQRCKFCKTKLRLEKHKRGKNSNKFIYELQVEENIINE